MTTDESIKQAIKELAIAQQGLENAKRRLSKLEKPLTWPELPDGSTFVFERYGLMSKPFIKICGAFFHHQGGKFSQGPYEVRKEEAVTRVNLDGTPYEGDPRA